MSRRAFVSSPAAAFAGVTALLFAVSAAITVPWCSSMAAMSAMPMPGGWTMSMAWMRLPGKSWLDAAASFTGMWEAMMVAMMLPSLAPTLWRYREVVARAGGTCPDRLAAVAGTAYFLVWTAIGAAIFPVGVSLAALEMEQPALARCVPMASGVVVVLAGVFQFHAWKKHHLACYSDAARGQWRAGAASAWRFGLRLGLHCAFASSGVTAILLVLGVMNLRVMIIVTAAITAERLAPDRAQVARIIGAAAIAAGVYLISRAAGLA